MNLSNISFAEKTGIITGGTQGIGYAIAKQFVTMGGRAVLIGRDEENGRAATEKLGNASFYSLDLNVCDKIPHVFRQIIADEKYIDILINNAGILSTDNFEDLKKKDWDEIINVNLTAVFLSCQEMFRHMAEHGGGRIVNVASIAGKVGGGYLGTAAYASAKAGVISLTKAVAKAGSPKNIYCNSVCPGYTKTPLVANLMQGEKKQKMLATMNLHRAAEPEEVASTVLFLASDAASFIQGENINCDGGMLMDG